MPPSCENEIDSTPKRNADPTQPLYKRQKKNDNLLQLMEERRKERNEILKNISENRDDDVDVFFKSIAMSVKKLRPELVNEAKMKALQTVFDLEKRNATVSLPQCSPSESSGSSFYSHTPAPTSHAVSSDYSDEFVTFHNYQPL